MSEEPALTTPESEAAPAPAPELASGRYRKLKGILWVLAGAVVAAVVWLVLPLGSESGENDGQEPVKMPEASPSIALATILTPREFLEMADSAERDLRTHDALRLLERGLERCDVENPAFRAVFFERLASLYDRLDRRSAAEMLRANALRLAKEAGGIGFQLDLARESGRSGNRRAEQRILHRLLLVIGDSQEEAAIAAAAERALVRSLDAEWQTLVPAGFEALPEAPIRFEARP